MLSEKKFYCLDVGVVVYNHSVDEIFNVLKSLVYSCEYAKLSNVRITVLDNAHCFDFIALNQKLVDACLNLNCEIDLEYFSTKENMGYGAANNYSIFSAEAKYHLILNPDVIFYEDSISKAINYFKINDECVVISPKIYEHDNAIVSGIKAYPSVLVLILRFINLGFLNRVFTRKLSSYARKDIIALDEPSSVEIISGCCMLYKKDILKRIGGFSPKFLLYFEDFDLSLRTGTYGKLYYVPDFRIKHFGGHTGRKGYKHIKFFVTSMVRFFSKFGWKLF